MYIRNRYICDNCNLADNVINDKVIRNAQCRKCGYATTWWGALEFNDNDLLIREYCLDGTVIEHDNPIKLTSATPQKPTVTCPYCNSTNCKKLGAISRGVSFGLFGFGSGKIGKQWHCNSCKSDF